MTTDSLRKLLGWSLVVHILFGAFWFGMVSVGHDFVYGLHSQFFALSVETFDIIHYAGMALYKIMILFFLLVPYFVLRFTSIE